MSQNYYSCHFSQGCVLDDVVNDTPSFTNTISAEEELVLNILAASGITPPIKPASFQAGITTHTHKGALFFLISDLFYLFSEILAITGFFERFGKFRQLGFINKTFFICS